MDVTPAMLAAAWAVWDDESGRPYSTAWSHDYVTPDMAAAERAAAIAAMQRADAAADASNDDLMRRVIGAALAAADVTPDGA